MHRNAIVRCRKWLLSASFEDVSERAPLFFGTYSTVVNWLFSFGNHVCAQWYWIFAVTNIGDTGDYYDSGYCDDRVS